MADGPPKRMLCQRWEGRQSSCEGSGVSRDRFASGDSPIHLSLTLTQGPGVSSQPVVKPHPPPQHHQQQVFSIPNTGESLNRGDSMTGFR